MPSITAVLHTANDALRLGRALETLYPCDDILIIDHGSHDGTVELARQYGARFTAARTGAPLEQYFQPTGPDWILCLDPRESLTESLAASLFEWKLQRGASARDSQSRQQPMPSGVSLYIREETPSGWIARPTPETRLVRAGWNRWQGRLPAHDASAPTIEGELLRFAFP